MTLVWKLRRELRWMRQRLQVRGEMPFARARTRRYDRSRAAEVQVCDGGQTPDRTPGGKFCLLLIHQPDGLAASILETVSVLADAGLAVLIVSNAPLSAADLARLAPHVWRIVQRPNIGYDFGGYREGIRQIDESGADMQHLVILNDSTWFPVCRGADFLARLMALDAGIGGGYLRHARRKPLKKWVESYCISIPHGTLNSGFFRDFWRDYTLVETKYGVVRRGEMGLSLAAIDAGLHVDALASNALFVDRIAGQPSAFLYKTLHYCAEPVAALEVNRRALLEGFEDSETWRRAALNHIRASIARGVSPHLYCFATVHLTGFPFLKKSGGARNIAWRATYLMAVDAGDLPEPPAAILGEVRAQVVRDAAAGAMT